MLTFENVAMYEKFKHRKKRRKDIETKQKLISILTKIKKSK